MWSPKKESDGKRSQYYDNMRAVRTGDFVVSYADTAVRAFGKVTDPAIEAPRPEEFGAKGQNWAATGWLVAVAWLQVDRLRPKDYLTSIAPLLPLKYSPLRPATGDGNQKAYLSEISEALFAVLLNASDTQWTDLSALGVGTSGFRDELDDAEEQKIWADASLSGTERDQLSKARRGQGLYRKNLFIFEQHCRLTGIASPSLLIASHIKPWRACKTAQERLDGNNGLLLAPNADYLFDRGLISFEANGDLIVSSSISPNDLKLLGIPAVIKTDFRPTQQDYLAYHRENIFQR